MPAHHRAISASITCPTCRRWQWREVVAFEGLAAVERYCGRGRDRCGQRHMLVFRRHRCMGVVRLHGRDTGSVEQALRAVPGLSAEEVSLLVSVADLLSQHAEAVA